MITASVTSDGLTGGTATIINHTRNLSVNKTFTGETDSLCGTNAEIIVEDFQKGGENIALDNFGTMSFTDCKVQTSAGGTSVSLKSADTYLIRQDEILTNVKVVDDTSFDIQYLAAGEEPTSSTDVNELTTTPAQFSQTKTYIPTHQRSHTATAAVQAATEVASTMLVVTITTTITLVPDNALTTSLTALEPNHADDTVAFTLNDVATGVSASEGCEETGTVQASGGLRAGLKVKGNGRARKTKGVSAK